MKILKEPTFHFLLLAAAISFAYWALNAGAVNELSVDRQEIEARILVAELTQGYAASEEQREQIERQVIDDYLLVLEAYEMGLQNDARINDILAQKMRHVLSGNVIQPTDQELRDYYSENIARYTSVPRVTTDEIVFNSTNPLPEPLMNQLENGISPENLVSDLNRSEGILPRVTYQDLVSIFSRDFADQVFSANINEWAGPYISARGQHWIRVLERFPESVTPMEDIVDRVRLDWVTEEEEQLLEQEIARIRDQYAIIINSND